MRVLYSHYLTNRDHPAARMVESVAAGLRQEGHEVLVHGSDGDWRCDTATPKATAAVRRGSFLKRVRTRLWFLRGIAANFRSFARDRAAIEKFRPDVVLCRSDPYRFSMQRAARRAGVPLVTYADAPAAYECRGFPSERWHPPQLLEMIERWGLKRSRAAVTVSHPAKEILDAYGTGTPVTAVSNGVELERFPKPRPEKDLALRQRFGVATPLVAGFLGTFQRFHGVALLAQLIERTADRADLTWLLVGDGPEIARLKEAARRNPRVVFAGRQPPELAAQLLASMDVLVAPHARQLRHFYFCPLKILEAMAAGAVCLASDQGDIPRLLEDGAAGRLVATDEPADWTAELHRLLDDPELRKRLARNARRNIEENYTWERTALGVMQVLEDAARSPADRPTATDPLGTSERSLTCR